MGAKSYLLSQHLADRNAVDFRQHQVQKDEVVIVGLGKE